MPQFRRQVVPTSVDSEVLAAWRSARQWRNEAVLEDAYVLEGVASSSDEEEGPHEDEFDPNQWESALARSIMLQPVADSEAASTDQSTDCSDSSDSSEDEFEGESPRAAGWRSNLARELTQGGGGRYRRGTLRPGLLWTDAVYTCQECQPGARVRAAALATVALMALFCVCMSGYMFVQAVHEMDPPAPLPAAVVLDACGEVVQPGGRKVLRAGVRRDERERTNRSSAGSAGGSCGPVAYCRVGQGGAAECRCPYLSPAVWKADYENRTKQTGSRFWPHGSPTAAADAALHRLWWPAETPLRCPCAKGLSGRFCDVDINECELEGACLNGGFCTESSGKHHLEGRFRVPLGEHRCQCLRGWHGLRCEHRFNACKEGSDPTNSNRRLPAELHGSCISAAAVKLGPWGSVSGAQCADEEAQHSMSFDTIAAARFACISMLGNCTGVYDERCDSAGPWKLCKHRWLSPSSSGSCVGTPPPLPKRVACPRSMQRLSAVSPCATGGKCVNLLGAFPRQYRCKCKAGFTGGACETDTDECRGAPCGNGTCADSRTDPSVPADRFVCRCKVGYSGERCREDIDECAALPCDEAGSESCAQGRPGSFSCKCKLGWAGKLCDKDINGCATSPCKNKGVCHRRSATGYSCRCHRGFNGDHCEGNVAAWFSKIRWDATHYIRGKYTLRVTNPDALPSSIGLMHVHRGQRVEISRTQASLAATGSWLATVNGTFYVLERAGLTLKHVRIHGQRGRVALSSGGSLGGGAISIQRGAQVSVVHCELSGNGVSTDTGGAIAMSGGALFIANSNIFGNRAQTGGAIFATQARIYIKACRVHGNAAGGDGGALRVLFGGLKLEASNLTRNTARNGAALYKYYGALQVLGTRFDRNRAGASGGAIYAFNVKSCSPSTSCVPFVKGSRFTSNAAGTDGGAVTSVYSRLRFSKAAFLGNTARRGVAMWSEPTGRQYGNAASFSSTTSRGRRRLLVDAAANGTAAAALGLRQSRPGRR